MINNIFHTKLEKNFKQNKLFDSNNSKEKLKFKNKNKTAKATVLKLKNKFQLEEKQNFI